MSFMFHPFPYSDPEAVNDLSGISIQAVHGIQKVARELSSLLMKGKKIAMDAYPGADLKPLVNVIRQNCAGTAGSGSCEFVDAAVLLKRADEIETMLAPYLPMDKERDPVLMYGRRYREGYAGLQERSRVEELAARMQSSHSGMLVYGLGSMVPDVRAHCEMKVWVDITPRTAVLAFKNGKAMNIGANTSMPYSQIMRRNYYVDFEAAADQRWEVLKSGELDYYIAADIPESMLMIRFADLEKVFEEICRRPFRCRPVYLEGVWGGFYIHRLRKLPKTMRNCAWVFDLIPLEVSLAVRTEGFELEVPFFTFVQFMGEKLLGKQAYEQFGGYFPIRFNYDDTYHSSGNMSVQCHPDADYVVGNHGELGRQDESYYICLTGQGARTFLGFKEADSCKEFFEEARRAESTGEKIPYENYIHSIASVPGTQVMIPAGTVHASGRNQVILEIGSLTIGSYTYKLYDYQRIDPQSGKPRPIHLKMGGEVIRGERTQKWVEKELVNYGHLVREGEDWKEVVVGEHDLLYFSLRNLVFDKTMEDNTDGLFHVLALVDGEKVRVQSCDHPEASYTMNSMDIIVVPACLGRYTLTNLGAGTVTVHKTRLK